MIEYQNKALKQGAQGHRGNRGTTLESSLEKNFHIFKNDHRYLLEGGIYARKNKDVLEK